MIYYSNYVILIVAAPLLEIPLTAKQQVLEPM